MDSLKVAKYIVKWLKKYAIDNKMSGFVIGISGGIDSALTSTLCSMTKLKTLCLELPIKQNIEHTERSRKHISFLKEKFPNVISKNVDLNNVFNEFNLTTVDDIKSNNRLHALANTRSRLRMATLYYYAALDNLLVAGTGNKVEDFGVGFYTKYGDGGVDVSPIADLLKSEVRDIANALKINKSILEAKPTDGLWDDNRTDEQQLNASYEELEWAMKQTYNGKKIDSFSTKERQILTTFYKHNNANKHKMNPIPVCNIPLELK